MCFKKQISYLKLALKTKLNIPKQFLDEKYLLNNAIHVTIRVYKVNILFSY